MHVYRINSDEQLLFSLLSYTHQNSLKEATVLGNY